MRYLLDTNVVSSLIRDPHGPAAHRVKQVGATSVCTSIIVSSELRFGALRRHSPRLTHQVEAVLRALDVLPFEAPADAVYARIRRQLEAVGQPISGNDMLIAAQAIALGYTIVTDNVREFGRIEELTVENWVRDTV